MKLAVLLLCVQVLYCTAGRKKAQEPELTSIPCNDPGAQAAADLSLRQLNENRKRGEVYALKRITSVQEQYEDETGTVYYLTLDVVETECNVLSRKDWKDCRPKSGSDAVFGQCKVVFHLSKTQRIAQLYNYDCTLRPIVRGPGGCPGCPVPVSLPLNDSSFQDIANRAIKKFNEKSNYDKYFTIGNITKATAQVIAGIAYNVEFTIQETTCNNSVSAEELALCEPLDCEFAHTGYCKSRSLAHWSRPNDPYVSVTCKVFEPEASAGEEEKHKNDHAAKKPDRTSGRDQSGKKDKKGKKEGDGRKRDENHEHNHQHLHPFEHHHEQEGQGRGRQSDSVKPVGKIRYEGTEEESKDKTGKRNPEKEKGTRGDRTPRRANNPADRQVRPVIRSFPEGVAASAQCPGEVREYVPPPAPEDTTALPY